MLVDDVEDVYSELLYSLRKRLERLARDKVNTEEIKEVLDCLDGYWIISSKVDDGVLHVRVVLPSAVKYYRLIEKLRELKIKLKTEWRIKALKAVAENREIPEFDVEEINRIKEEVERMEVKK